jgi:hypothetical protein
MTPMRICRAHKDDASSIWRIIGPIIRAGETYALDRDMTEADALAYWLGEDRETFVAEERRRDRWHLLYPRQSGR